MLDDVRDRYPDRTAVVDGETRMTFDDLQRLRLQAAAALLRAGIREGDHVAVLTRRSWETVVTLHALWYLGVVIIPLNTTWEADEIKRALVDAEVGAVVVSEFAQGKSIGDKFRTLGLPWGGDVHGSPDFPQLRHVFVDEPDPDRVTGAHHLQSLFGRAANAAPPRSLRQELLGLFTSGSTAAPKCAILRQDGLLGTAEYLMRSMGVRAGDRFLSLGAHFHAGGLIQMLGAHLAGATHYLFDGLNVPLVADTALAERCNVVTGFDPVLNRLLDEFAARGAEPPIEKVTVAPGVATYQRLAGYGLRPVMNYALTEGGNFVALTDAHDDEHWPASNGRPLPGISVKIVDKETGVDVPPGVEGEICFKGWNLFRGYFNVPSDGQQTLTDDDDYFHTKDLGTLGEDGRLYYGGRYAPMIKTGGENVSEAEVEAFLMDQLPVVQAAAVIGVPDDTWGEAVVAFVELVPGATFDGAALRDACRGKIAGYKIPKRFIEVSPGTWPVTQSGKLLKRRLTDHLP